MTPRLLHIIYFPWDRDHKLKADENDFDQAPIESLRQYAPDFEIRLWTWSRARDFCRQQYPEVWTTVEKCPHPTMMVDILRWLMVLHFGGIYWQVSTTPLVPMASLLPAPGKSVRLFTEFVLTPAQCLAMAAEPIRRGEPEEPVRVLNQVFAAEPGATFIRKMLDLVLERNRTHVPERDYDVLYVGANAALSTAYDRFGKNDPGVELVDRETSKRLLHWRYLGSWRKETPPATVPPPEARASRLDRFPAFGAGLYRFRRHPHERLLEVLDAAQPRTSVMEILRPWIEKTGVRSACEAPSGSWVPADVRLNYLGGDPRRAIVRENRRRASGTGIRFARMNLLYSRFPRVDLFLCADFLEWLAFGEVQRVLRRIAATAQPRYLALTGYRWLSDSWDAAFGDFRPIDFEREPFRFSKPVECLPLPPREGGRPDRCLMVWKMEDVFRRDVVAQPVPERR